MAFRLLKVVLLDLPLLTVDYVRLFQVQELWAGAFVAALFSRRKIIHTWEHGHDDVRMFRHA